MKNMRRIVILYGGQSDEREVSLRSVIPVFNTLKKIYPVQTIQLDVNALPEGLDPQGDLIFPLIHGDFGEDGQLQHLLEAQNFAYIGSDAKTSELCIHKLRSKALAQAYHITVLPAIAWEPGQALDVYELQNTLQVNQFVLKPVNKGSSIGVTLCNNSKELLESCKRIDHGSWMIEPYVHGREITVGILQGRALGAVEICPKQGFYDFKNKYTAGACEYRYPAPISAKTLEKMQRMAETFFEKAHCLDFGRVDFILEPNGQAWFLEMNSIPGMTDQSLLPKSAACLGIDFESLLRQIIQGALERFQ